MRPEPASGGTRQFAIIERLGAGAMGVVYLARDRDTNHLLALKSLQSVDPAGILQLKNEFRSLADMSHPNLVDLYDLFEEEGAWFFTMEHVGGVDFLTWARPDDALDEGRLRDGLLQLAEGLAHLHQHRKLHRDIKPSNILVDRKGQVRLLDFGLVTRIDDPREASDDLSGTLEYMPPEAGQEEHRAPAADWYSVGVLLYQCLTGALPFEGPPLKAHVEKMMRDPEPPSARADVPPDLETLCLDLLSRDAARRPGGPEVLRRLRGDSPLPAATLPADSALVGRERHLSRLERALERADETGVVCLVHGTSGMGKSALVRQFLEGIEDREDLLMLRGRCFEREAVPYKAFDTVIDELTRALIELTERESAPFLPDDAGALARLFPVLQQIEAFPVVVDDADDDPRRLRQRAFGALRQLFERLNDRWLPVVFIDDLQWGDADSAALVAELLRPPSPPLLFLGSYRTEEADTEFLRPFTAMLDRFQADLDVRRIPVGALEEPDARRLAGAIYAGPLATDAASAIARESGGNPFFIEALVRHLELEGGRFERGISVPDMLRSRMATLPDAGRRLLEVVAVAGGPVLRAVACDTASVGDQEHTLIGRLRAEHLVRVRSGRLVEELETYHDRIRESVAAALAPNERVRLHGDLAVNMEATGIVDPEILAEHFQAAERFDKAHRYTAESATRAADALAFDRAATLYEQALDLYRQSLDAEPRDAERDQERDLQVKLARALVNAGRGAEAADAFMKATVGADTDAALSYKRLAGEQLLASGRIGDGLEVIEQVLEGVGLRLPSSPMRALPGLLRRRLRVERRGTEFAPRTASQVPRALIARIDACWSVGIGLGFVDHIRASDFQLRNLELSLEAGEPYRVTRALAMEAAYSAALGPEKGEVRAVALQAQAAALAESVGQPHAKAMARYALGVPAFLLGHWSQARAGLTEAIRIFRDECRGAYWEITSIENMLLSALAFLGELGAIAEQVPTLLEDARGRGNLYGSTNLRTGYPNLAWLALDDPDTAERQLDEAMGEWTHDHGAQEYYALNARTNIELYRGNGPEAWAHLRTVWWPMVRSLITQVHLINVDTLGIRGRCAVAALAAGDTRGRARRVARSAVRKLEASDAGWGRAHGTLIRAALHHLAGDEEEVVIALRQAAEGYAANEMALHAAAARARLGERLQGDEGRALRDASRRTMHALGVVNADGVTRMLAPGFDGA